jgi:hypothetical protein
MIIKNFINGQITTGTEPIDPISGVSRGLYINSVLSGNSSSDTLVGLDINPSYSGIAGNYFGLRVSGDTIFATSGGTQVFRTTSSGNVIVGESANTGYKLDVGGVIRSNTHYINTNSGIIGSFSSTGGDFITLSGLNANSQVNISVGDYGTYPKIAQISMGAQSSHWQGYISFWTTNPTFAERMRLTYSGNLLIGTTTDSGYRLDVNGDTRIKGAGATSGTTGFTVVNSSNEVALQVLNNKWIGMQVLSPSAPLHVYYPGTTPQTKTIAIFDGYQSPAQPEMQIQVGTVTNNFASFFGHKTDMGGFVKTIASSTFAITWDNTSNLGFGGSPVANNTVTIYPRNFSNTSEINTTGAILRVATGSIQIVPQTATPDTSMVGLGIITLNSNVIAKTYTNAINLYIDGPPVAGNNTTITNRWSMYVNSGNTYFGGRVMVGLTGDTGFQFTSSGSTLLRGSGTTSSSSALTVQNSSGGTLLNLTNNGNLNVDNGALYVDGDNGRVGVGTTSPTNPLDVAYSPGRLISFKAASGYADIGQIVFSNVTSAQITSSGSMGFGPSDTNRTVTLGNGFTSKITTPGSTKYDGFGNQTPSTLAGSTNQPVLFTSTIPDGNIDGFIFENTSSGSRNLFKVIQDNTTLLTLNPNGNLLLGTTTDLGFKLSVSGSTLLRGSGTTSASYALATQNSSGGTTMVVNNAGNMLIGTTTDAGFKLNVNGTGRVTTLSVGDGISNQGTIYAGQIDLNYPNFIRYQSAYYFTIQPKDNSGNSVGTGGYAAIKADTIQLLHDNYFSVAIATTTNSSDTVKLKRGLTAGHIPMYIAIEGSDAVPGYNYGTRSGSILIYPGEQSFDNGYGSVVLAHNGINERGSVLIGTSTTNNSRLLVGGTVSGATLSTTRAVHINPTLLATGNTTTLIGLDIQPRYSIGSYTGLTQIALRVSGGTQIIGSGSTGTTLSLFSVDGASGRLFDVTDDFTNSLFSVNTSSGVPVIEAFANNSIVMGTYGSNALVVSGRSTYFGVIPSDSNYRIISSGATLFSGGTMVVKGSGTTSGSTALSVQNSSGGTLMNLFDNGNLNIDNGVLYVNGDTGNVGIGTTSPSEKLSISAGNMSMESGRFIKFNYSTPFWIGADGTANGFTIFDATASLRRFSITTAGNVLIGTTTDSGHNLNVNGTSNFSGNMTLGGTATLGSTVIGNSGIAIGDGSSRGTWTVGVGYVVNMSNVVQSLGVGSVVPWMNNSISLGAGGYADSTSSQMIMVPMAMSATTMSSGSTAELYISNNTQSRLSIPNTSVINAMVTVDYIATCTLTGSSSSLVYNDVKSGTQKFYVKRWFINNVGAYFTISTPVDVYSQSDSAMSGATLSYEYVSASTFKVKFNAPPTANGSTFRCAATVRVTTYKD